MQSQSLCADSLKKKIDLPSGSNAMNIKHAQHVISLFKIIQTDWKHSIAKWDSHR